MGSITEQGLSYIPGIIEDLKSITPDVERFVDRVRTHLLNENHIIPIDHSLAKAEDYSLATIDGGVILEQLAFANLIVAGATIGQGARNRKEYEDENDSLALTFFRLAPHRSDLVNTIPGSLMASQELSLLGNIPHNIKILDGSWTSSLTSVFLGLLKSSEAATTVLSSALTQRLSSNWTGMEMVKGIDYLVSPWRYANKKDNVVALSKSDSSMKLVHALKRTFGADLPSLEALQITDRTLAAMILEPGEMLTPFPMDVGASLAPRLTTSEVQGATSLQRAVKSLTEGLTGQEKNHYGVEHVKDLPREVAEERENFLKTFTNQLLIEAYNTPDNQLPYEDRDISERLSLLNHSDGHAWIWGTYFMPTNFSSKHRALRIEFARDTVDFDAEVHNRDTIYDEEEWGETNINVNPDSSAFAPAVIPKAQKMVALIDQDLVTPEIFEPWSQYVADRKAKDVSQLKTIIINSLIHSTDNSRILAGILRGYRT